MVLVCPHVEVFILEKIGREEFVCFVSWSPRRVCRWRGAQVRPGAPGEPLLTSWASVPWRMKRRGEGLGEETERMAQF